MQQNNSMQKLNPTRKFMGFLYQNKNLSHNSTIRKNTYSIKKINKNRFFFVILILEIFLINIRSSIYKYYLFL